jgi:hypothetical protein
LLRFETTSFVLIYQGSMKKKNIKIYIIEKEYHGSVKKKNKKVYIIEKEYSMCE